MSNKLNLTWRDVLDPKLMTAGKHIEDFLSIVEIAGYTYFNWNGLICKLVKIVGKGLSYEATGLRVVHLED